MIKLIRSIYNKFKRLTCNHSAIYWNLDKFLKGIIYCNNCSQYCKQKIGSVFPIPITPEEIKHLINNGISFNVEKSEYSFLYGPTGKVDTDSPPTNGSGVILSNTKNENEKNSLYNCENIFCRSCGYLIIPELCYYQNQIFGSSILGYCTNDKCKNYAGDSWFQLAMCDFKKIYRLIFLINNK